MYASSEPLAGTRFCLAGPGRVGASLAAWLSAAGGRLVAVAGRHRHGRASEVAERLGGEAVELAQLTGRGENLLLVTVSDPALDAVAAELARGPAAPVALHTAGSRGADALSPLEGGGTAVGTLHPLKAFPRVLPDPEEGRGVVFAVDGAAAAQSLARRLAEAWGGEAVEVPAAARRLYHFAAALAAGGVVTLVAAAAHMARELGLPAAVGRGYLELARGALAAVEGADGRGDVAGAITGPVARGDGAVVAAGLDELEATDPASLPATLAVSLETLRQLALKGPLSPAQEELAALLRRRAETLSP